MCFFFWGWSFLQCCTVVTLFPDDDDDDDGDNDFFNRNTLEMDL